MNRADTQQFLKDGNLSFEGGCDSNTQPDQLQRNKVSRALNATGRGGEMSPRPGWKKIPLTFDGNIQGAFQSSNFQEGFFYDGNGVPALLSSQGGRQFRIDIANFEVSEITPTVSLYTLTTVANFNIPAVGSTVGVNVADSSNMTLQQPVVTIGGYTFTLTQIASPTFITVQNNIAAQVGILVAIGSTVMFTGYDINNPNKPLNWSIQAENYWILQDNQSYPIIYDGSQAFRSNPATNQIPVGNVMCYAAGRIAVALHDRETYAIGDLVFGSSGTILNSGKDAILYFKENMFLNEGGDFIARIFGAPSNAGEILSMKACSQSDTQLGQGPMLVGTPNVVFSVNLPFDRTTWKNLANALQTANPIIGPVGQSSTVLVNTDMWYRSIDGIRCYIMAQRQFNGSWANTPMSNEVDDVISADTEMWLEHGSGVLFDNRLLITVSPQKTVSGVYHRGFVVMDFNTTSGMGKTNTPAWDGYWTGLRILKVVAGLVDKKPRCFMYVLNDTSQIELWELSTDARTDDGTPISWEVDLPSYNCGSSDQFKRLKTARIIITALSGDLTGQVDYISDESSCWNPWFNFTRCAKNQDCGPFTCAGPQVFDDQTRYPIRLPDPPDVEDPVTKRFKATGYEFQPRLKLTGYCHIKQVRIYALPESEALGIDDEHPV